MDFEGEPNNHFEGEQNNHVSPKFEMDIQNPWSVANLDFYLYYCCPQCDHKSKTKPNFIDHAHAEHPESKVTLNDAVVKKEISQEPIEIKQEFDAQEGEGHVETVLEELKGEEEGPIVNYNEQDFDDLDYDFYDDNVADQDYIDDYDDQGDDQDFEPELKKPKKEVKQRKKRKPKEQIKEEIIEGPIQCYRCGEEFEDVASVKEHQTSKHKVKSKKYYGKPRSHQCHVCQGMYETEDKLNNHSCNYSQRNIEELGENRCDICNQTFKWRDQLNNHNRIYHVDEKKFACDQCDFKVSYFEFFAP